MLPSPPLWQTVCPSLLVYVWSTNGSRTKSSVFRVKMPSCCSLIPLSEDPWSGVGNNFSEHNSPFRRRLRITIFFFFNLSFWSVSWILLFFFCVIFFFVNFFLFLSKDHFIYQRTKIFLYKYNYFLYYGTSQLLSQQTKCYSTFHAVCFAMNLV